MKKIYSILICIFLSSQIACAARKPSPKTEIKNLNAQIEEYEANLQEYGLTGISGTEYKSLLKKRRQLQKAYPKYFLPKKNGKVSECAPIDTNALQKDATVTVLSVDFAVSKTGEVTPIVLFSPIKLDGKSFCKIPLADFDQIKNLDIRVGDKINLVKENALVPKIKSIEKQSRGAESKAFQLPTVCPYCGKKLTKNKQENAYYCTNLEGCKAISLARLEFFVSKMGLKGFNENACEKLVTEGKVKAPCDLYGLNAADFEALELPTALYNSVQQSKKPTFVKFVTALGIKSVTKDKAEFLAIKYSSISQLAQANKKNLKRLKGIDEKIATNLVLYFHSPQHQKELAKFRAHGVI